MTATVYINNCKLVCSDDVEAWHRFLRYSINVQHSAAPIDHETDWQRFIRDFKTRSLTCTPGSPTPLSLNQAEPMQAAPTQPWQVKTYKLPAPTSITTPQQLDLNPPKPADPATNLPAFLDEKLPTLPYALDHYTRAEIEMLLRRIFPRDLDAISFLSEHNHGLRAKPLELLTRDEEGLHQVLAYLRQAAANQPPRPDAIDRFLLE